MRVQPRGQGGQKGCQGSGTQAPLLSGVTQKRSPQRRAGSFRATETNVDPLLVAGGGGSISHSPPPTYNFSMTTLPFATSSITWLLYTMSFTFDIPLTVC